MKRYGRSGVLITETETYPFGEWTQETKTYYEDDQCVQPGAQVVRFRESTVEVEIEIDLQTAFNMTPDRKIQLILHGEDGKTVKTPAIFCGGTAENHRVLEMFFRFQS